MLIAKPGTREAVTAGCSCPVMDNFHGKGRYGDGAKYGWWYAAGCPLHTPQQKAESHDKSPA